MLVLGLSAGGTLGLAGMASGQQYLSDVVWSALLTLALLHALYYWLLRLQDQDGTPAVPAGARCAPMPRRSVMIVLLIVAACARSPNVERLASKINWPLLSLPLPVLEVKADSR